MSHRVLDDGSPHPRDILRVLELSPRKSMGQNFLISGAMADKIVAAAGVVAGQIILEIGPGLGALTRRLAATGAQVIALEKDRGYYAYLMAQFAEQEGIEVRLGDALEWDYEQLLRGGSPIRVVANLPYNVAVPILFHLLASPCPFKDLHVMVQREVAERMVASPGSSAYGALTVNLGLLADACPILDVPPDVFYPAPRVTSSIVRLIPHTETPFGLNDEKLFKRIVKAAFGNRRKTLRNALAGAGFSRDKAAGALRELGVNEKCRGETLSLSQFCALSRLLAA